MPAAPLRILAFEPFDAGSHRAVRESISRHSQHQWTWLTRPGRAWKWRMRLAAIELLDDARARSLLDQPWDVFFTTSLLGVADLRALLPAHVRSVPLVLYMHENQAEYPQGPKVPKLARTDMQFALTNLTSILAADLVLWNSRWNRDSFIEGITALLRHAPDTTLLTSQAGAQVAQATEAPGEPGDLKSRITARSRIIWPPVEPPPPHHQRTTRTPGDPIRVLWPHRWEHDKGPDELLALAHSYTASHNLRWTILGEQFAHIPPALAEFQRTFSDRIDHMGYLPDRDAYWTALHRCDWVLSTAKHEFFGIAVVEALLAGCLPWLPDRLSYPELTPKAAHGLSPMKPPADEAALRAAVAAHLEPARSAIRLWDAAISSAGNHCQQRVNAYSADYLF